MLGPGQEGKGEGVLYGLDLGLDVVVAEGEPLVEADAAVAVGVDGLEHGGAALLAVLEALVEGARDGGEAQLAGRRRRLLERAKGGASGR